jgi:mannose-6-phosphate isomerase-like protein (cupin superfamily)
MTETKAHLTEKENLPHSATAHRFEGYQHGGADISFFLINSDAGGGPELHAHPYAEVFVIEEGEVAFTAGDETFEAKAGQIVVVPAGVPHKYVNSGAGKARHIDIHASGLMATEWLES